MSNSRASSSPVHILVVTTYKILGQVIKQFLEEANYSVELADGGQEALFKFMENRSKYAVVITDNLMTDMTGPEVAEFIERRDRKMPIIILSGTLETLPPNAHYMVKKPFTPDELCKAVQVAIAGKAG